MVKGRCNLYFKGLVGEHSLAGFGVAICRQNNDLLFQMKGEISSFDITVLEAELTALKRGLTEARRLGINHISIYCDYHPIYKLVTESSVLEKNKAGLLLRDVQLMRRQFTSSILYPVSEENIRYAYKLARETIVSQGSITQNNTCTICLGDDINADQMFSVYKCGHQFCSECVKRHIEVRLLEGSLMRCPHYRCQSKLTFENCVHLLTPKLKEMWRQKIKEDSIPFAHRVYCPNPKCSVLMSKIDLSKSNIGVGVKRSCFKCRELFCIDCKVLWHKNLSCKDYIRLHPNPTTNDEMLKALAKEKLWRQCGKCQHMIELSIGCVRVKCRCGHDFCYHCGAVAGGCRHGHALPLQLLQQQLEVEAAICFFGCVVLVIVGIFYYVSKHS